MQHRAEATVEMFFEATAQILQRDAESAVTTTDVANRAGFSIGTLYTYFPNKQSLLRAMALREIQKQERAVLQGLAGALEASASEASLPEASVSELARIVVRAIVSPFAGRYLVRRKIMLSMANDLEVMRAVNGMLDQSSRALEEAVAARQGAAVAPLTDIQRFILLRTVLGATRSAVFTKAPFLGSRVFEDELVRVVVSFFEPRMAG